MTDINNQVSYLLNIAEALGYTVWITAEAGNGYEDHSQIVWHVQIHRGTAYHNAINPIAEGYHIDVNEAYLMACSTVTEPMIKVA